ncbi:MAG TPA: Spy/CpxP family protein refolding chaperone [Caulobacteraceae bacterium]|jgi:Spy/CpxP family protein refolding chaperone
MKPTVQRVALAAALGFGFVVSAAAQDRGPGPTGAGPGRHAGQRGGDRQKLFEDIQHRREQRLHDLLQIKPDQETAFRTFVTAEEQLRPKRGPGRDGAAKPGGGQSGQPGARRGGPEGQQRALMTTPERLDRQLQRLAEVQQRMQKQAATVKTFYAAMSPEQRKVMDEFPATGMGGRHGHGFGGHGFGGRGRFMHERFEGQPPR